MKRTWQGSDVADDSKKAPRKTDVNTLAFAIAQQATGEAPQEAPPAEKDAAAVALGRKGGRKGGRARAAKLTPEQRSEAAKLAASARWKKFD
jgi:hypothetical protein